MSEQEKTPGEVLPTAEQQAERPAPPPIETTTGPHLVERAFTTRRMMVDVLIGLLPVTAAAVWFFRSAAVMQMAVAVAAALLAEAVFQWVRGKRPTLSDGSAVVTALILAFSVPPTLPLGATVFGTVAAIFLGKMVFGGLGYNIFNPAMVGRAVLMATFGEWMTRWVDPKTFDTVTGATPLAGALAKTAAKVSPDLVAMFSGNVSGSLGETSAAMIILGGLWLLARKAGDWRLTVGMLAAVAGGGLIEQLVRGPAAVGVLGHLVGGGVMFAAFFIVTDPVSSPLTRSGRWIFGLGVGALVVVIRLFSYLPEGVLYAVLVMNAMTPLINRWTAPRPLGGHVPAPRAA